MDEAVVAGHLPQPVLRPQLRAVEAGEAAGAPRHVHHQRVQRRVHPARAGSSVDDLRDLPERDAGAQAGDAACSN